jgi:hypothetical protein
MWREMSNDIKILGHKIGLGESAHVIMDFARLHNRAKVEVPIIVERGKKPGPRLLLVGGIHGDEVNGVEIVRQIISKGINKPDVGTVICIPLLNVFGFLSQQREFPDGRDLNRVFPGSKDGSLASRFAYHVMKEVVPHVDYCIDYHTGGGQRFNYTHLRVDSKDKESLKLAEVFGTPYIMLAKNRDKSFRESLTKLGKRVLLFEGGKSLNLDKTVTRIGIQGAINVMHHLGMKDFSSQLARHKNNPKPIILTSSKWIRAKHSGMYRAYVSVGQKVEKGVKLGSISDPYGEFERVFKNLQDGYIINSTHSPVVNQGDALFHIGFE